MIEKSSDCSCVWDDVDVWGNEFVEQLQIWIDQKCREKKNLKNSMTRNVAFAHWSTYIYIFFFLSHSLMKCSVLPRQNKIIKKSTDFIDTRNVACSMKCILYYWYLIIEFDLFPQLIYFRQIRIRQRIYNRDFKMFFWLFFLSFARVQ